MLWSVSCIFCIIARGCSSCVKRCEGRRRRGLVMPQMRSGRVGDDMLNMSCLRRYSIGIWPRGCLMRRIGVSMYIRTRTRRQGSMLWLMGQWSLRLSWNRTGQSPGSWFLRGLRPCSIVVWNQGNNNSFLGTK